MKWGFGTLVGVFFMAQSSLALPTLGDITGDPTLHNIIDDGSEIYALKKHPTRDFDLHVSLDSEAHKQLFIYDPNDPTIRLVGIENNGNPFSTATFKYSIGAQNWSNGIDVAKFSTGDVIGVGVETSTGKILYSQNAHNNSGIDHVLSFPTAQVNGSAYTLGSYTLAFEDGLPEGAGGHMDWDEVVVIATELANSDLSNPSAMGMFALSILLLICGNSRKRLLRRLGQPVTEKR